MKDLRTENYKTLLEELKEDIIKEKDSPGSWVERLTLSRRQYSPKLLIGSVQSLSKFQWCSFFTEMEKLILKFIENCKDSE